MADERKLEEDELVKKLVPDPAQGPPNATVLRGYLGRGTDKGSWRLYATADLDEYAELSEADVLHTQKLPDDQGTLVWVSKTLELRYVRVRSDQVQADFLQGHIALAGLQPGAGAVGGAPGTRLPTIETVCSTIACPVSVRGCLSHTPCPSIPCITVIEDRCPPSHPPCPSVPCHSHTAPCASYPPCPSVPCHSYTTPCVTFATCPLREELRILSHVPCPSVPCLSHGFCPTPACPTFPACQTTTPAGCHSQLAVCAIPLSIQAPCATPTASPSQLTVCTTWGVCEAIGPDPDDSEQ